MIQNRLYKYPAAQKGAVTVIIPVLNESETIASVVQFASKCPLVGEIIVVDDGSIDGTPEAAEKAGAVVITSTLLGKGASMEDGMREAKNDVLLYLDGDLSGLSEDLIEKMTRPLFLDEADFVKARFSRSAGRVTILTARPLIRTYFPELESFEQPLSGIMAARKSLLQNLRFENDYGVDIGLFIDAFLGNARLMEVDIGHLSHDSHPLEVLGDMATQVARTVLDRAGRCGRLRASYVRDIKEKERRKKARIGMALDAIRSPEKLALFDMDGVLLNGRFIVELAERTGKTEDLKKYLDNFSFSPNERMKLIGSIFAGIPKELFEETAREIPLISGAVETIVGLRKMGFRVGIVTDSYHIAAETVRRRVFADFCFAHLMQFRRGKATGKIHLCPAMIEVKGCAEHDHCKLNVLYNVQERLGIGPENILAVGDGHNDICMLKAAGCSIAFQPKTDLLREAAQNVVENDLREVLVHAEQFAQVPSLESPAEFDPGDLTNN